MADIETRVGRLEYTVYGDEHSDGHVDRIEDLESDVYGDEKRNSSGLLQEVKTTKSLVILLIALTFANRLPDVLSFLKNVGLF